MTFKPTDWALIAAWALDFARCVEDRPRAWRWLFRLALGRYGRREYRGIVEACEKQGIGVRGQGYELQGCDYHRE